METKRISDGVRDIVAKLEDAKLDIDEVGVLRRVANLFDQQQALLDEIKNAIQDGYTHQTDSGVLARIIDILGLEVNAE